MFGNLSSPFLALTQAQASRAAAATKCCRDFPVHVFVLPRECPGPSMSWFTDGGPQPPPPPHPSSSCNYSSSIPDPCFVVSLLLIFLVCPHNLECNTTKCITNSITHLYLLIQQLNKKTTFIHPWPHCTFSATPPNHQTPHTKPTVNPSCHSVTSHNNLSGSQ